MLGRDVFDARAEIALAEEQRLVGRAHAMNIGFGEPRRRMPTTFSPIRSASGVPDAMPKGMISARTPLMPTIIAPSPMREN